MAFAMYFTASLDSCIAFHRPISQRFNSVMTIVDPFAGMDQYCRWIDIHPFAERDHYCKWTNDDVITLWNYREFVLMLIGLTLPYRRHLRRS